MAERPLYPDLTYLLGINAAAAEATIKPIFSDRLSAGQKLGVKLREAGINGSWVYVAIPRGGIPVARTAAPQAHISLAYSKKIPLTSDDTRFGAGAIGPEGTVRVNRTLLDILSLAQLPEPNTVERVQEDLRSSIQQIGVPNIGSHELSGRNVVVIDDAIASGYTMAGACETIRSAGAQSIIIASPVAHRPGLEHLHTQGFGNLIVLHEVKPDKPFLGDAFYCDFREPTIREIQTYLQT